MTVRREKVRVTETFVVSIPTFDGVSTRAVRWVIARAPSWTDRVANGFRCKCDEEGRYPRPMICPERATTVVTYG